MEAPHPLLLDVLRELDAALTALADDLVPALLMAPPNMELAGAARDRIKDARDALREMIEQNGG